MFHANHHALEEGVFSVFACAVAPSMPAGRGSTDCIVACLLLSSCCTPWEVSSPFLCAKNLARNSWDMFANMHIYIWRGRGRERNRGRAIFLQRNVEEKLLTKRVPPALHSTHRGLQSKLRPPCHRLFCSAPLPIWDVLICRR